MGAVPEHARRFLVATQVVFFACVLACVVVDPSHEASTNGISYYGVHAPTLPLVSIAYVVGSLGVWRSARVLARMDVPAIIVPGMRVVAVALPAELLTPFNHGPIFNWTHMAIGIIIGVTQMMTGTILLVRHPGARSSVAFLVQLSGGLLAAVSLPTGGVNQMFEGEVIFALGYTWSLLLWLRLAPVRSEGMASLWT